MFRLRVASFKNLTEIPKFGNNIFPVVYDGRGVWLPRDYRVFGCTLDDGDWVAAKMRRVRISRPRHLSYLK